MSLTKLKLDFRDHFFFFLIAGLFTIGKGFAVIKIDVGPIPLFISEAVMFFLLVSFVIPKYIYKKGMFKRDFFFHVLFLYLSLGAVNLILNINKYGMFAIRDAVMVYYSVFILITLEVVNNIKKFEFLYKLLYVCGTAGLIIGALFSFSESFSKLPLIEFIKEDSQVVYYSFLSVGIFCFFPFARRKLTQNILILSLGIALTEIVILGYRSVWLALAVSIIFVCILTKEDAFKTISDIMKTALRILPLFVLIIAVTAYFQKDRFFYFYDKIIWFIHPEETIYASNTTDWRFALWQRAIHTTVTSFPMLGAGFGCPYQFQGIIAGQILPQATGFGVNSQITMPHNVLISVFYKMGLLGLLCYLTMNILFFVKCLNFYNDCRDNLKRSFMLVLLGCFVCWQIISLFFPVLENPQNGIFLWVLIGLGLSLTYIGDREINITRTDNTTI